MNKIAHVRFLEDSGRYNPHQPMQLHHKTYDYLIPEDMEIKQGDMLIVRTYNNANGPLRFASCTDVSTNEGTTRNLRYVVQKLDLDAHLAREKAAEEKRKAMEFLKAKTAEIIERTKYQELLHLLPIEDQKYIQQHLGLVATHQAEYTVETKVERYYRVGKVTAPTIVTHVYAVSADEALDKIAAMWEVNAHELTVQLM